MVVSQAPRKTSFEPQSSSRAPDLTPGASDPLCSVLLKFSFERPKTDEGTSGKELVVDIGVPETEREIEIVPLEEPVPGPTPVESPVEDPAPA